MHDGKRSLGRHSPPVAPRLQRLQKSSVGDTKKVEGAGHEKEKLRKEPGVQAESGCDGLGNKSIRDNIGNQLPLPCVFSVSKAWENLCNR